MSWVLVGTTAFKALKGAEQGRSQAQLDAVDAKWSGLNNNMRQSKAPENAPWIDDLMSTIYIKNKKDGGVSDDTEDILGSANKKIDDQVNSFGDKGISSTEDTGFGAFGNANLDGYEGVAKIKDTGLGAFGNTKLGGYENLYKKGSY